MFLTIGSNHVAIVLYRSYDFLLSMDYEDIQEIAVVYGKKDLIEEFLDQFHMDRAHDNAPLNAVLLEGEGKKELKRFVWKGD